MHACQRSQDNQRPFLSLRLTVPQTASKQTGQAWPAHLPWSSKKPLRRCRGRADCFAGEAKEALGFLQRRRDNVKAVIQGR